MLLCNLCGCQMDRIGKGEYKCCDCGNLATKWSDGSITYSYDPYSYDDVFGELDSDGVPLFDIQDPL